MDSGEPRRSETEDPDRAGDGAEEPTADGAPPTERERVRNTQAIALAWNLGWPIAAGVLVGAWIDSTFGTAPAATLVLTLGALVAVVRWLIGLGNGPRGGEQ